MLDKKIAAYSKTHSMLPVKPNAQAGLTYEQLQEWWDTAPEEIRVAFNALIDELASSVGAAQIGFTGAGFASTNTAAAIVELLSIAQAAQAGTILPGTIAKTMLTLALQAEIDAKATTSYVDSVEGRVDGLETKVNGVYFRNNVDVLEWSTDGATWNPVGSGSILSFNYGLPKF